MGTEVSQGVRTRRGAHRGLTLAQKILAKKSGRVELTPGEIIYAEPDLVLLYDWPGLDFLMSDIRIDPDKIVLNIDHFYGQHGRERQGARELSATPCRG